MYSYIGQNCDVCNKTFCDADDIVVCPECGTPHHRDCYFNNGKCINFDKHAEGFEYRPTFVNKAFNENGEVLPNSAEESSVCSACNAENMPNALFCANCGNPMGAAPATPTQQHSNPAEQGFDTASIIPNGSFITPNEEIDEIPAKDWALYIGGAAPYYLYHFKKQNDPEARGLSFTLSAFLLPEIYFLYRRMWLWALLITPLSILLSLPSALILLVDAGALILPFAPAILSQIASVCGILFTMVRILSGFFAVKMYRKNAGTKIKKIKLNSASADEYYAMLRKLSGPSKILIVIIILWMLSPMLILML